MKDTIIKLFNLEPSDLEDIEVVSTDFTVYAIVILRVMKMLHNPISLLIYFTQDIDCVKR